MKMNTFGALAALAMTLNTAGAAGFQSIKCCNLDQGIGELELAQNGYGSYDLKITPAGSTYAETVAGALNCRNQPNSGDGTYVSLVNCSRYQAGKDIRVLVTHQNVDWVDVDGQGYLKTTSTGKEVQLIIQNPFNSNPYQRILTFIPSQCHQE